jgi:hypothetical protein
VVASVSVSAAPAAAGMFFLDLLWGLLCTKAAYVLFYQRRPQSKSKKNIPAAAGAAETETEATTSSLGHNGNLVNGDSEAAMNGVSDEDMEIN